MLIPPSQFLYEMQTVQSETVTRLQPQSQHNRIAE